MKIAYYPGCSLESSSDAYDLSVKAVCEALELELETVDDWNCCGATEAAALDQIYAYALVARNLARVGEGTSQLVAPCAACYLNLKKTDKVMKQEPEIGARVSTALAAGHLSYQPGKLRIRHLLDVIYTDVGKEALLAKVKKPLAGIRVAAYYGCQVVRPDFGVDNTEYPTKLDEMLQWLGATVVDYPLRSHCCGGHMTQISEHMSNELIRRLLHTAHEYEADVMACLCPMCQLNVDAYQGRVNNAFNTRYSLPILFFTQLVGLALGISSRKLGFGREIVSADNVIRRKLGATEDDAKPKTRKDPHALPMPGAE